MTDDILEPPATGLGRIRVRATGELLPHGRVWRNDRHSIRCEVDGGVSHSFSSELYEFVPDGWEAAYVHPDASGLAGRIIVRATGEGFPLGVLTSAEDARVLQFRIAGAGTHKFDSRHYAFQRLR